MLNRNIDPKQIKFMSEEMKIPESKVIMLLDNPPEYFKDKPCEDCKEKENK